MVKKLILTYCICVLSIGLWAQHGPLFDYDALFTDISDAIRKGEKRALRDLGTLLDLPEHRPKCLEILKKNTLFLPSEININESLNRDIFLKFYYDNEQDIQFSTIANVFFISALKKQKVKFELAPFESNVNFDSSAKMRKLSDDLMMALSKNNYSAAINKIVSIGNLNTPEAFDWLINLSENKAISKAKQGAKEGLGQALFSQLSKDNRIESLNAMLYMLNKEMISASRSKKYITRLSNVPYPGIGGNEQVVQYYNHLIDSLGTFEDLRHFGYQKYFDFNLDFFDHPVDYYGQILSQSSEYPWLELNAIKDLTKIGKPRSLLYLAANVYKSRFDDVEDYETKNELIFKSIEKLTQLKLGLKNSSGETVFETEDASMEFKRDYFIYWASHFEEYIWEDNQHVFINKNETAEKIQSYEKLFRRLSSKNDSIAYAAFKELCKGDPIQIAELSNKYRQLLRNYNSKLPSFQYNFLESMSRLTEFCKSNNIKFEPEGQLLAQLNALRNEPNAKKRFQGENDILNSLTLEDITALEYWACLKEPNKEFNFSMGRIIDKFYSKNWSNILEDEQQMRTYLKKSYLFENIGIIGTCNAYLRKFDINSAEINTRLNTMLQVESDSEIANQITQLIDSKADVHELDLKGFIEDPTSFGSRDIKLLPEPNFEEGILLAKLIGTTEDMEALKKIFFYLRFNSNPTMVPELIKHINDERVLGMRDGNPITVGSNLVPIFENIYNYKYEVPKDEVYNRIAWKSLWMQDSLNYKSWGISFLEKELKLLEAKDTISIAEVNEITSSLFFDPIFKNRCLELLGDVYPEKDIRKFEIEPALDVDTDLKYFRGFRFKYKVLDDIAQLFDVKKPETMLHFLMNQSQDYSVENLGRFYNKLFQFAWFQQFLNASTSDTQLASRLSRTLTEYLDQSDFISEFEEQNTFLHIAQLDNIGKPLIERLTSSVLNDLDEGSKFKIQQDLISGISYEELATIINYLDKMSAPQGTDPLAFLRKDFGLPIFNIDDPKTFIKNHKNMSQKEFYLNYLSEFGVEIENKGKLDIDKIYEILEFEIVSPFVGDGGVKRDNFVYGVIKVLELTYNTTLDFHEKLNENQSFYTFSATKRAMAWMDYLKHNGLVKLDVTRAPSFNLSPEALAH